MSNKKNIDDWVEYARQKWLNKKGAPQFRPSTKQLIDKIKHLSDDPNRFGEAWRYVEELASLQNHFHDDTREGARMLLECALASYKMGNSRQSVHFLKGAIGFCNEDHDRAVARWLLGCIYWHLENEVEALSCWENAMHDFGEQSIKIPKNKATDVNWYEEEKAHMENAIRDVLTEGSEIPPPPPSGFKPKNSGPKDLLQDIPVIGQISAGIPLGVLPDAAGFMEVDQVLLDGKRHYIVSLFRDKHIVNLSPKQDFFILHVNGTSMNQSTPEPIENGDYVILHQQNTAESGDIVAVEIVGFDHRATLKRYKVDSGYHYLMPESSDPEFKSPMYLDHVFNNLDEDFLIRGIAVAVLKPM